MNKLHVLKRWIVILLFQLCAEGVRAQWTSKDSLWLQDVLINNKEIQLKPEILEAIKSGNLIKVDALDTELMKAPSLLPICKDFHQYIQIPDTSKKIDHTKMPPGVFWLYYNEPVPIVKLQSFSLAGIENYTPDRPKPILNTDPLSKGQAGGGVVFMICINDVINYYILKKRY